jgi:Flp pilus assembly protein TadD
MNSKLLIAATTSLVIISVIGSFLYINAKNSERLHEKVALYSGTQSCRPCHENFYQLWHDSHHGLAMQPVTADFIRTNIHVFNHTVPVGSDTFQVNLAGDTLLFVETDASGMVSSYPAVHTMGGKYTYYFLTPFPGGRLQVLPLAYDCNTDEWYNNPESGVRHFESLEDEPLDWKGNSFTFNTTCYSCHVSQLETNYNLADNSYNTTWREPGINCETCHGPSYEHIVECVKAGEGKAPKDLRLVQSTLFTSDQHNSSCGSCHAKATVIAQAFEPGGNFYDYFDLVTLEHPDFYADGRDLGENYTMTSWEMNQCAKASDMNCIDCHTSSGRYLFAEGNANAACLPCHSERVNNVSMHSYHDATSEGSRCISCHMPQTKFARMTRTDHSFRPPMPRATIAFGSPNACNLCHSDKSPEWAEKAIKETHGTDYQDEIITNGFLIRKVRGNDWSDSDQIIAGLKEGRFDNVYATSFIRLLEGSDDPAKWPVLKEMTYHKSPLVRGAAAHSLYGYDSKETTERLLELVDDEYRVVRLNAAYALSALPIITSGDRDGERVSEALKEYEASMTAQKDSWSAHYNLGNYYSKRNEFKNALQAYNTAIMINPEAVLPMVNAGVISFSVMNDSKGAADLFARVLSIEPDNTAALTNLALMYGENGDNGRAEQYFRHLLKVSGNNSMAACNLAVIIAERDMPEAVRLSRKAMEWEPGNPKYAYTYSYYLHLSGDISTARKLLYSMTERFPDYFDNYILLANILINSGENVRARDILERAQRITGLSYEQQRILTTNIERL